jgi:hypothetical protein
MILISGCEDPVPTDYTEEYLVEGILMVGEPIRDIRVLRTLPITQKFVYDSTIVRTANVRIIGDNKVFELEIDTSVYGYYYSGDYLVKAETEYRLEAEMPDGSVFRGKTTTPPYTQWVKMPPDTIFFPKDTLNLTTPDSLYMEWESIPGYSFYMVRINCLDTLEYGKYLADVADEEKNRRVFGPPKSDYAFRETSSWILLPASKTPVVWSVFKWYGLHEVKIMVPDFNFIEWFLQYGTSSQYNDLLGSIENGKGAFGSASAIRDTSFLIKNQP